MFVAINSTLSKFITRPQPLRQSFQLLHVSAVNPAARKGTREKARKKKVKVEIQKVGFIPHNLRNKKTTFVDKHIDHTWKAIPTDNAYPGRYYRWMPYPLTEAIQMHRETHDPTMYNMPDAPLNILIELNMQGEKKTRFVTDFSKLALIEYPFEHGEVRQVIAFAKDEDQHNAALDAGATLAGGTDLIKSIQKGDVSLSEYPYVVAHPNIMPELISLRGLLKRKFPDPRADTLGTDVAKMVQKCLNGINYRAAKDENQENFGSVKTCIGTLNMPTEHLVSNFNSLVLSVNTMRPKREGRFITRIYLTSPPSKENFKIDPKDFPIDDYEGTTKGGKQKTKATKASEIEEAGTDTDNDGDDDAQEEKVANAKN